MCWIISIIKLVHITSIQWYSYIQITRQSILYQLTTCIRLKEIRIIRTRRGYGMFYWSWWSMLRLLFGCIICTQIKDKNIIWDAQLIIHTPLYNITLTLFVVPGRITITGCTSSNRNVIMLRLVFGCIICTQIKDNNITWGAQLIIHTTPYNITLTLFVATGRIYTQKQR